MSISIDVEGFFYLPDYPPFNSNTSVRKAHLQWRTEVLQLICERMKWQSAPWGESNENAASEGDSCSWTFFEKLCNFARMLESRETELRFPHLLRRFDNGEMVIYLPTEFDQPFEIHTDDYPECCTISSSNQLYTELEQIKFHFEKQAIEVDMLSTDAENLEYLLSKLLKSSHLSVEMQLPMFLSW